MRTRYRAPVLAAILPLVLLSVGCDLVRAKAAFKDGNRLYKEENYRKAIDEYERAVQLKPDFAEAHFYLASSQQSLYRPGKEGEENRMRLDKAIEHFERALELNKGGTPNLQQLRLNTLGALTAIYSEPPLSNYEKALAYAELLVKDNPNDVKNLYAMANLYEKFGRMAEAEQTYVKVSEQNPKDAKACGALAAFYNKPLWDDKGAVWVETSKSARRAKFDAAIATLDRCADIDPADPSGHYKLAMFYWDKAYRDPNLSDKEKNEFADKGIETVGVSLEAKPDYWEAIITKGLLYRVKAQVASNPAARKQYLEQAVLLQKQAMDLRKESQASPAAGAGADIPPEAAAATEASKP
ncbi:MAG TPA: tetratricopeptide repeat protein [Vicinamibacteria bacterium]|nr:tetratricopeptide repeat protein [Vicinamibacteria bacterium]